MFWHELVVGQANLAVDSLTLSETVAVPDAVVDVSYTVTSDGTSDALGATAGW